MYILSDQFAVDEVESNYVYFSGYKPAPLFEQMATAKRIFPQLESFDEGAATKKLQPGAEGKFLIARWQELAPSYNQAVEIVLAVLSKESERRFYNYRQDWLGQDFLRQTTKKAELFQMLGDEQKRHNVLVIDAQFGLRHRGKCVRRARDVMGTYEVGLGAFEIGFMLLTHPTRLQHLDELWINAAGDEYAHLADGVFSHAPIFTVGLGGRGMNVINIGEPSPYSGSPSAFVELPLSE